jgi:SPP1 family predicted phage head-tail adaptor
MTQLRNGSWGKTSQLASRLNSIISIESASQTSDGQGGVTRSWTAVATCFAEVIPLASGVGEVVDAARQTMRVSYRVTLRTRSGITAGMRLVWREKTLNVTAVILGDGVLELMAEEGIAL